eukprot:1968337-Prymnesium_polylepis.2
MVMKYRGRRHTLTSRNGIPDSGDAHTAWNHLEPLKWAQTAPNTTSLSGDKSAWSVRRVTAEG